MDKKGARKQGTSSVRGRSSGRSHLTTISKKLLPPHPPPPIAAAAAMEDPGGRQGHVHVEAYKTSQLRKERFKKLPVCKSAPHIIRAEDDTVAKRLEATSSLRSHSAAELDKEGAPITSSVATQGHLREDFFKMDDPVLAYVKSARYRLGLETRLDRSHGSEEEGGGRDSLVAGVVVAGVRDLKLLSQRLSSLQETKRRGQGDFVYCLRRDMGDLTVRFNPYDLKIVSSETALEQPKYHTVSAFSVSEVTRHGGMEVSAVQRWLWERQAFYKLLTFRVFAQFKLRRMFLAWRKHIQFRKWTSHRSALGGSLFLADQLVLRALQEVRLLCETASSSSSEHALEWGGGRQPLSSIALIDVSKERTYSLHEFAALQKARCARAREQLVLLREQVASVVISTCKSVADREGIAGLGEDTDPQTEGEPSHSRVLEWRKVLERLARFVAACSNILLQLLQRLVLKAVSTLEQYVCRSLSEATAAIAGQGREFEGMRQQVASQPFTQSVLQRFTYHTEEEEGEGEGCGGVRVVGVGGERGLLSLQATSFSCLVAPVEFTAESFSDLIASTATPDQVAEGAVKDCAVAPGEDVFREIARLFQKLPEPVLPLWEVQLMLKEQAKEGTAFQLGNESVLALLASPRSTSSFHPLELSFEPSAGEFVREVSRMLADYEATITSFKPLREDKQLLPFISRSRYDLLMLMEEEEEGAGVSARVKGEALR